MFAGDRDAAYAVLQKAVEAEPANARAHVGLGLLAAIKGSDLEAARELELAERLLGDEGDPYVMARMAYAYGRIGRSDDALRLAKQTEISLYPNRNFGSEPGDRVLAYLAIGKADQALTALREAAEGAPQPEFNNNLVVKLNSISDPFLDERRSKELRDRIGAVD